MSANITIKEGGKGKILNAIKKLKISTGSGTSLWLPENDLVLDDKSITKNGTYKASDDGLYGYSEVTVNVTKKTSTSGKKPDGNDYNVERDQDGNIIETKLPSSIRLTTNPTKMTYEDGESIDMTGAVIKAYCGDGTLWEADGYSGGIIPLSEIEIDPTTAHEGGGNGFTLLNGHTRYDTSEEIWKTTYSGEGYVINIISDGSPQGVTTFVSKQHYIPWHSVNMNTSATQDGNYELFPIETGSSIYSRGVGSAPLSISQVNEYDFRLHPELTYEEFIKSVYGALETSITISWERPKDDEELTTSFNITVE